MCPVVSTDKLASDSKGGTSAHLQSKRSKNERTDVARESSRRSGSPFLLKILGREMLRCEWGGSEERIGSLS